MILLKHLTTNDRVLTTQNYSLSDYPIWMVASTPGQVFTGAIYCQLDLTIGGQSVYTLWAGYLSRNRRLTWPPARTDPETSGKGRVVSETGTNPAANTEIAEVIPTNAIRVLDSFKVTLDTDGNAADRLIKMVIGDGTDPLYTLAAGDVVTANEVMTVIWVRDYNKAETAFDGANEIRMPLPEMDLLPQAYTIDTVTDNLQAGDDFTAPIMKFKEWLQE